jgi:hypothetical protein
LKWKPNPKRQEKQSKHSTIASLTENDNRLRNLNKQQQKEIAVVPKPQRGKCTSDHLFSQPECGVVTLAVDHPSEITQIFSFSFFCYLSV